MPAVSTSWTCTKNVGAAIIRQDEAKPAICVEELHSACWHFLVAFHPIAPPPRPYCAAEQRDERAALHSMASSAMASSVGGTSRPRALAVLRLMTSSYLVGACTGRSAGFSPLRMRST